MLYSSFVYPFTPCWCFTCCDRSLRRTQRRSRTTESGWDTRAVQGTTTCTRSSVTQLWTEQLSKCTLRWHQDTESGSLAFRSSRQLLSQPNSARERALSSFTTARSSFLWSSGRLDLPPESSRLPTRPPSQTFSCRSFLYFLYRKVIDFEGSKLVFLSFNFGDRILKVLWCILLFSMLDFLGYLV